VYSSSLPPQFAAVEPPRWRRIALLTVLLVVGAGLWVHSLAPFIARLPQTCALNSPTPLPTAEVQAPPASITVESTSPTESRPLFNLEPPGVYEVDPFSASAAVAARQTTLLQDQVTHSSHSIPGAISSQHVVLKPIHADPVPGRFQEGCPLVLQSTILGVRCRAARINSTLCTEGKDVQLAGQTYLVSEIHPRRVVLDRQGETIVLTIP